MRQTIVRSWPLFSRVLLATLFLLFLVALVVYRRFGVSQLPAGFTLTTFATLRLPTSLAFGPDGRLYVSALGPEGLEGSVFLVEDKDGDGQAETVKEFATGFIRPLGLAFRGSDLYVSSLGKITVVRDTNGDDVADDYHDIITDLMQDLAAHQNNGLAFGPDGKLYITAGAGAKDPRQRGTILRANPDGTGLEVYASGIRNAYDLAFHPRTGELFATDNGEDGLGEDIPPDELNLIVQGRSYGWPGCWGKRDGVNCGNSLPSLVDFPAHVSANGMAFYTGSRFPGYGADDLFVAFYNTIRQRILWDDGLKVVHVRLIPRAGGGYDTEVSDFVTHLAQPLDVAVTPQGDLLIAEFAGGHILRVTANR